VPRLAIVVPLKDEEAGVPALLLGLAALGARLAGQATCEFVFVDDGSTDRTWAVLHERLAGRTDVRLVQHAQNQGLAAAIRTGVLATDAPIVASIDSDLTYDPAEIAPMLLLLDGADVVTASPYHPRGSVRGVPPWRLLLSRTLSRCYRLLLRRPVHTWTACFRVYRRAAVVDLPLANPGFLGTAELLVRVLRRGGVVREHPCELATRRFGQSKMRILRTIAGHVRLLANVALGRIK
jgi:dolichol-phosphate mannosyltransferase